MFAAHHRLADLVAIVDVNGQQALGYTRDVLDLDAARRALARLRLGRPHGRRPRHATPCAAVVEGLEPGEGRPHVVLAQTVFGHGVSFMERRIEWHYLPMDDEPVRRRARRARRGRGRRGVAA